MAKTQIHGGSTRRQLFPLAAVAGIALLAETSAFGASDFWTKKKSAEWTDQEKEEIRTKSPWAKKVDADSSGGATLDSGGTGGSRGGSSGGGGGGGGRGGGGGGGGLVPPNPGGAPATTLSIVWQSAKPIQEAHPLALPDKLNNHYVITVTGIPPQMLARVLGGRGGPDAAPADPTAGLKHVTTLVVKGKEPQNPDLILSMGNNTTILFGFDKTALPLSAADKEVEFDLKVPGMTAKAKFNLKEMMYQEQLAL